MQQTNDNQETTQGWEVLPSDNLGATYTAAKDAGAGASGHSVSLRHFPNCQPSVRSIVDLARRTVVIILGHYLK
jgi:hypothetical protein